MGKHLDKQAKEIEKIAKERPDLGQMVKEAKEALDNKKNEVKKMEQAQSQGFYRN